MSINQIKAILWATFFISMFVVLIYPPLSDIFSGVAFGASGANLLLSFSRGE